MPEQDRFYAASLDARDAIVNLRTGELVEIAARLYQIGEDDLDGDAYLASAELHILGSRFDDAERALARARERVGAAKLIERRIEGLRVLRVLGAKVAALAISIGRINARHAIVTPRERGELESRMSAMELVLEGAGLDLDALEGGYDKIIGQYFGVHHEAIFRLALSLESLVGDLFPNVERSAILGTIREHLELSLVLLHSVAGTELATKLAAAARAAAIDRLIESGEELFLRTS